ncbi:hypothetical protein Tco_1364395, partial [Tanacetum coccineum]
ASDVFSRVVAANMEVVMSGSSLVLTFCMGIGVEKPGGGVISLSFVMLKKHDQALIGIEEFLRCENRMGQGLAQIPVNVGASQDLRGDSRNCVSRSLPWRESFGREGECGF